MIFENSLIFVPPPVYYTTSCFSKEPRVNSLNSNLNLEWKSCIFGFLKLVSIVSYCELRWNNNWVWFLFRELNLHRYSFHWKKKEQVHIRPKFRKEILKKLKVRSWIKLILLWKMNSFVATFKKTHEENIPSYITETCLTLVLSAKHI